MDGDSPEVNTSKFFKSIGERFGWRANTKLAEKEIPTPNIPLQERINRALAEKNIVSSAFESQGATGFFGTNERLDPQSFRELSQSPERPNGYIIGAGVSSIFTSLEAFSTPPSGIILINIDPKAAQSAKDFVDALVEGKVLLEGPTGRREFYIPGQSELPDYEPYNNGTETISTRQLVRLYANRLITLAQEGKIAVLNQDLFNRNVLEVLKESLPNIERKRNIINLSNIGDWIMRAAVWGKNGTIEKAQEYIRQHPGTTGLPPDQVDAYLEEQFRGFKNLEILAPTPPNFNYYMDTSTKRGYMQRITKSLPNKDEYEAA